MTSLQMREVLNEKYGLGPTTYVRGTKKIDGVYATRGIIIESGRYMQFEKSPSDHRWIEINIYESSIIGTPKNHLCPPPCYGKQHQKSPQ